MRWRDLQEHFDVKYDEFEGVWYVAGLAGLSFDIVRPPDEGEKPLLPPWEDEVYEILDPDHAFVLSIAVHSLAFPDTRSPEAQSKRFEDASSPTRLGEARRPRHA
jgi:hypothetical protein